MGIQRDLSFPCFRPALMPSKAMTIIFNTHALGHGDGTRNSLEGIDNSMSFRFGSDWKNHEP